MSSSPVPLPSQPAGGALLPLPAATLQKGGEGRGGKLAKGERGGVGQGQGFAGQGEGRGGKGRRGWKVGAGAQVPCPATCCVAVAVARQGAASARRHTEHTAATAHSAQPVSVSVQCYRRHSCCVASRSAVSNPGPSRGSSSRKKTVSEDARTPALQPWSTVLIARSARST